MSKKNETAIAKINPAFLIPTEEEITEIKDVAGENPPFTSLKAHPEWNGCKIIVMHAEVKAGSIPDAQGEIKDYVLMAAAVYPPSREPNQKTDVYLIATGAGNVFVRVLDAIKQNAFPIRGTLRAATRAWLID